MDERGTRVTTDDQEQRDHVPWNASELRVTSDSRRTARYRLLQSWYRENVLGLRRHGKSQGNKRPVGSMLHEADVNSAPGLNLMPEAAAYTLARVRDVRASGGTAEKYRLQHNMLSSMPLCFSVFGTMRGLPDRGLGLVRALFDPLATEVEWVECEWKPVSNPLQDRTAFDAALLVRRENGTRHLIGVETKYTEPFSAKDYLTDRYEEVHEASHWFRAGTSTQLRGRHSNQLWRNSLLAAACELQEDVDRASVVVLALGDDPGVAKALPAVQQVLRDEEQDRCRPVSLEALVDAAAAGLGPGADWADRFRTRYLDLKPVAGDPLPGSGTA